MRSHVIVVNGKSNDVQNRANSETFKRRYVIYLLGLIVVDNVWISMFINGYVAYAKIGVLAFISPL
jgi:hypothetical protein